MGRIPDASKPADAEGLGPHLETISKLLLPGEPKMTGAHVWARVRGNARESAIPVQKLEKKRRTVPPSASRPHVSTRLPQGEELTVPGSVFWDSYLLQAPFRIDLRRGRTRQKPAG